MKARLLKGTLLRFQVSVNCFSAAEHTCSFKRNCHTQIANVLSFHVSNELFIGHSKSPFCPQVFKYWALHSTGYTWSLWMGLFYFKARQNFASSLKTREALSVQQDWLLEGIAGKLIAAEEEKQLCRSFLKKPLLCCGFCLSCKKEIVSMLRNLNSTQDLTLEHKKKAY